jgi:hypothetical protein
MADLILIVMGSNSIGISMILPVIPVKIDSDASKDMPEWGPAALDDISQLAQLLNEIEAMPHEDPEQVLAGLKGKLTALSSEVTEGKISYEHFNTHLTSIANQALDLEPDSSEK